jgi:hypothetical protein
MSIERISEHATFGGKTGFYRHHSDVNDCDMRFAVFVPPGSRTVSFSPKSRSPPAGGCSFLAAPRRTRSPALLM